MAVTTSRVTSPSRSRVCRVWASIFSLTPCTLRRSALNRYPPSSSASRASTDHLPATCASTSRDVQSRAKTSAIRAASGSDEVTHHTIRLPNLWHCVIVSALGFHRGRLENDHVRRHRNHRTPRPARRPGTARARRPGRRRRRPRPHAGEGRRSRRPGPPGRLLGHRDAARGPGRRRRPAPGLGQRGRAAGRPAHRRRRGGEDRGRPARGLHQHRQRGPQHEPPAAGAQGHRRRAARVRAAVHDLPEQLVPGEVHGQVPQYLATGEVLGIDGDARIGAATRADMAAATTAALLDEGTAGATFELSGPPITLAGLAETVTDVTGTKVAYRDVTPEELTAILRGTGLDDGTAGFVVALEESVARGDLDVRGDDLGRLLGRPATTLADALRADHR